MRLLAVPELRWPEAERWPTLLFATVHDGLGLSNRKRQLAAWAQHLRSDRPMIEWLTATVLRGHFDNRVLETDRRAYRALRRLLRGQAPN
jgi:hypothetical protein